MRLDFQYDQFVPKYLHAGRKSEITNDFVVVNQFAIRKQNKSVFIHSHAAFDADENAQTRIIFAQESSTDPTRERMILGYIVISNRGTIHVWCSPSRFVDMNIPTTFRFATSIVLLINFEDDIITYPMVYRNGIIVNVMPLIISNTRILSDRNFIYRAVAGRFEFHRHASRTTESIKTLFQRSLPLAIRTGNANE